MKVTLLFLFFFVAVAVAIDSVEEYGADEVEWPKFKKTFDKHYSSPEEEARRLAIFKDTLKAIKEHNIKYKNGEVGYGLGINGFADLKSEEVPTGKLPYPGKLPHTGKLPYTGKLPDNEEDNQKQSQQGDANVRQRRGAR